MTRPSIARSRGHATRADAGISSTEYLGIIVLSVVLVGAVVAGVTRGVQPLVQSAQRAVCSITGDSCGGGDDDVAPQAAADTKADSSGTQEASDDDRRDTARDARDSRREDRGRDDPTQGPDPTEHGGGHSPGLGEGVPGESVTPPGPQDWQPVDDGAGPWDSESSGFGDDATKFAAELAANSLSGKWPHASRNLLHFLGNSGEALEQDVDALLTDVPALAESYTGLQDEMGLTAVERAKKEGATGPVTYPLSTPWTGFYIYPEMSQDWFYAMGGIQYAAVGEVTVYPPTADEPRWTYETTTSMVLRDQYNWDGSKSTEIGPFMVTDEQLAELHRAGKAQEFTATGESAVSSRRGAS